MLVFILNVLNKVLIEIKVLGPQHVLRLCLCNDQGHVCLCSNKSFIVVMFFDVDSTVTIIDILLGH